MVYGGPADEQIQLNEESVYAGKRMDRNNPAARRRWGNAARFGSARMNG